MNDVAPALKARVQKAFRDGLEQQAALKGLSEKNSPDYTDARAYGEALGGELAEAFKQISGDDLPNGHMYYNIAEKVVVPLIDEAYAMAADYCEKTQNALNEKAGLGIKAVRPELDPERTESIVNKLDATEKFEDAKWILDDAVQNVVSSASDTSIKANAEAQYRAGLRPKVTRDSGGKCCDWCAALDGVYYYPDVPKEVYARHNNCTCSVEYSPSEGRRQDVWSKKWQGDAEPAAILSRTEAAKANEAARDARDAEQRAERRESDWMLDHMGQPMVEHLDNNRDLKTYKLDGYDNIWSQTYSRDAKEMADYVSGQAKTADLDRVVIARHESLGGIAAYDHTTNTLYISEELVTPEGFVRLVDQSYFAARDVGDVLVHELDGHREHWAAVDRYMQANASRGLTQDQAKQELEQLLRGYVNSQLLNDRMYVNKFVSKNAGEQFSKEGVLNELIADTVVRSKQGSADEILVQKVREVLDYDA